jgi:FtsH-binding integral membrane protein
MFETLLAKTFTILGSQLSITWLATIGVIGWVRHLYRAQVAGVTATRTADGKLNLEIEWSTVKPYFYTLLVADIAVFLLLLFKGTQSLVLGIPLFTLWSVLTGIELALALISVDENLGGKVLAITATITFMAALIGMYSGVDFAFLSTSLFGALILLLIGNLARLFISIPRARQRVMAFFGVIIFTGYLLLDFNRLAKLEERNPANSWYSAMDLTIDIYLDIINLFLELLDLLSG